MCNKISIDNLTKELIKILTEYKEDIEEVVEDTSKEVIKEAKKELAAISPKASKKVTYTHGAKTVQTTVNPRRVCCIMEYKKRKEC